MTEKQKQAIQSKRQFVLTAYELIREKGYDSVTVQEICERCGKSVGAFYHYFSTKEDVIAASYKMFDESLKERYHAEQFSSWKDAVRFLLDAYLEYSVTNGLEMDRAIIIAQLSSSNTYITRSSRNFYCFITEALTQGAGLSLDVHAAESYCDCLIRTVRGTIFAWVMSGGNFSLIDTGRADYERVLAEIASSVR
ncbi:MAG: TetR/AcrR family transcriptional regulator [Lachnospiraceae bacterium]|nr:TetR/AcrR family transcriptional regulator [Lachnospiraceae bacterium]